METSICIVCGGPLLERADYCNSSDNQLCCKYCLDKEGNIKTFEQKVSEMADFISKSTDSPISEAKTKAVKNLMQMPYWRNQTNV